MLLNDCTWVVEKLITNVVVISCSARDCGPLPVPTNGSSVVNLTTFPNKILFNCDEGFNLSGSDVRHCQANGTWSGNQTYCEGFACSLLLYFVIVN